ncbi:MAG: hypothetical protein Tsb009_24130 [Planctomycetaceae bacterium]
MYREFWNLRIRPFQNDFDARFLYPHAGYQSALLKIQYAIENRLAAALLVGEAGVGKTFLTEMLEITLSENDVPVIRVGYPQFTPMELLRYLLQELSQEEQAAAPIQNAGLDQLAAQIHKTLLHHHHHQGKTPVLIFDRADQIQGDALFPFLRQLLDEQTQDGPLLTIVLVGEPSVVPRIQRYASLSERIAIQCSLPSLNAEETSDYIAHRLHIAGSDAEIFEPAALQAVFKYSSGSPLRINHICELGLLIGFADRTQTISEAQIHSAVDELIPRAA